MGWSLAPCSLAIICSLVSSGCSSVATEPPRGQGAVAPDANAMPQVAQSARPALPTSAVIPPDRAVPRDLARWSGIWLGKWDGTWFTATVVRKIETNGTAAVEYSCVERMGELYTTHSVADAKIENDALSFGRIKLTLEPVSPDCAFGEDTATQGRIRPSDFTKAH